jgi:hypothetical protein
MAHTTTVQHRPQADTDTDERDPQIRSLILPDLVSAEALVPEWLRKRFRERFRRQATQD